MSRKGILSGCCVKHMMTGIIISIAQFSRNRGIALHLNERLVLLRERLFFETCRALHPFVHLQEYKGMQSC